VTEKGYGKLIASDDFRLQNRGGKGSTAIKFKSKAGGGGKGARDEGKDPGETDALRCMRVCRLSEEAVFSTAKGSILRQGVEKMSIQSRGATGVLLQKIDKGDRIRMVDFVPGPPKPVA
jgi:DNA gyrase subunit A